MTAAPEPGIRLALVSVHSPPCLVATSSRLGTDARGHLPRDPIHSLRLHRCFHASRTTILCPQGRTKQCAKLLQPYLYLPSQLCCNGGYPDQQHENPKTPVRR